MKQANRDRGAVIWFTGLSGSGKTTIAHQVEETLLESGIPVEILDGDVVRENLSKGLGFSKEDRDINIRRIAFVAHLLQRNGVFVITAAISPYRAIREEARAMIKDFVEVYAEAPLEVCEQRDVKGLYAKARAGEIKGFTGVDDPYEPPPRPEVVCKTDQETVEESAQKVIDKLIQLKLLEA
jgi:adenylylsulfate kinase